MYGKVLYMGAFLIYVIGTSVGIPYYIKSPLGRILFYNTVSPVLKCCS